MSPGSLVHIGDKFKDKTEIIFMKFNKDDYERTSVSVDDIPNHKELDDKYLWWIIVDSLSDVKTVEKLAQKFEINELVTENILNTSQRTNIEEHKHFVFTVVKRLFLNKDDQIDIEQISLIIGKNFVITFLENGITPFNSLFSRVEEPNNKLRKLGSDYLSYLILDFIVDDYFYIIEDINIRMEDIEVDIIERPDQKALIKIHKLRKELMMLQKIIWPLREVISTLVRFDGSIIKDSSNIYYRDVYDHLFQILDTVDAFMDMLSGMLDIYLTNNGNKMNEVMKVLTIISTIFMPITFIVGVYGMNFDFMPELRMVYGYTSVWLFMFAIVSGMIVYFRKKKWI